jgi:hypothetical protein
MPKGSLSLVAKEVRGAALDQLSQTLTPRQTAMVEERKLLVDRFKSRDLPEDYVKDEKKCEQILKGMDEAQAQASAVQQGLDQAKTGKLQSAAQKDTAQAEEISKMVDIKVQEALSRIASNMATAKGVKDGNQLGALKLLFDQQAPQGTGEGTSGCWHRGR